jgi:hypothetical protein
MRTLAVFIGLAVQVVAHAQSPHILQIYREPVKPGREAAYQANENDTARICAKLGCPHPYLAIETLSGPKEVWFLNGYDSPAEQQHVAADYARNARLMAALGKNSKRKASLTGKGTEVFARYRQDLSRGALWILGRGRFLVITVTNEDRPINGTVFESVDGTRLIILPARTRGDADVAAALAGAGSIIFAVRPSWSHPAHEWITADPDFWRR